MNRRTIRLIMLAFLGVVPVAVRSTARAQTTTQGRVTKDEFFIVSSLNLQKHQMVLKLPTEVTMQMSVNDKTSIVDEKGKHLKVSDLRAGDTAYVTYIENSNGAQALSIRLGPMTIQELHRRYLNGFVRVPAPVPAPSIYPRATKVQRSQSDL